MTFVSSAHLSSEVAGHRHLEGGSKHVGGGVHSYTSNLGGYFEGNDTKRADEDIRRHASTKQTEGLVRMLNLKASSSGARLSHSGVAVTA